MTSTTAGYSSSYKDFQRIFDTQKYYEREQAKNFAAGKTQVRLPSSSMKQELKHCDTINCNHDNGIKTVYIRNIITKQLVEQHLCRNCLKTTKNERLFSTYYNNKISRLNKFRYYFNLGLSKK